MVLCWTYSRHCFSYGGFDTSSYPPCIGHFEFSVSQIPIIFPGQLKEVQIPHLRVTCEPSGGLGRERGAPSPLRLLHSQFVFSPFLFLLFDLSPYYGAWSQASQMSNDPTSSSKALEKTKLKQTDKLSSTILTSNQTKSIIHDKISKKRDLLSLRNLPIRKMYPQNPKSEILSTQNSVAPCCN